MEPKPKHLSRRDLLRYGAGAGTALFTGGVLYLIDRYLSGAAKAAPIHTSYLPIVMNNSSGVEPTPTPTPEPTKPPTPEYPHLPQFWVSPLDKTVQNELTWGHYWTWMWEQGGNVSESMDPDFITPDNTDGRVLIGTVIDNTVIDPFTHKRCVRIYPDKYATRETGLNPPYFFEIPIKLSSNCFPSSDDGRFSLFSVFNGNFRDEANSETLFTFNVRRRGNLLYPFIETKKAGTGGEKLADTYGRTPIQLGVKYLMTCGISENREVQYFLNRVYDLKYRSYLDPNFGIVVCDGFHALDYFYDGVLPNNSYIVNGQIRILSNQQIPS